MKDVLLTIAALAFVTGCSADKTPPETASGSQPSAATQLATIDRLTETPPDFAFEADCVCEATSVQNPTRAVAAFEIRPVGLAPDSRGKTLLTRAREGNSRCSEIRACSTGEFRPTDACLLITIRSASSGPQPWPNGATVLADVPTYIVPDNQCVFDTSDQADRPGAPGGVDIE